MVGNANTFLHSKLARRTLLLFVLSALVPILVFSRLMSGQVDSLYERQQQEELRRSAKNIGLLIFERISSSVREAESITNAVTISDDPESLAALAQQRRSEFSIIRVIYPQADTQLPANMPVTLFDTEPVSKEFAARVAIGEDNRVWLAFSKVESPAIVIFQLSPELLWDQLYDFDLSKVFEIYGVDGQLLFISDPRSFESQPSLQTVDSVEWHVVFQGLPGNNKWLVVARDLRSDSFSDRVQFHYFSNLVTLLAILLASFVAVNMIRRNLQPIQALREGIKRIAKNQFDTPVEISSGDEFELLGDTFNSMSSRLGRYIYAMKSLSAIDQLILNRLKVEDIVDVVLKEGMSLLSASNILFIAGSKDDSNFSVFSKYLGSGEITIPLQVLESIEVSAMPCKAKSCGLPEVLRRLVDDERIVYVSLLRQEKRLLAVLLVEFDELPEQGVLELTNTFSDHVAVAMSNAEWEERLFIQAHYDLLTGLPNRYLFNDHVEYSILQAKNHHQKLAVLFIDIDDFKSANDVFGHDCGDQLLQMIAARLSGQVEQVAEGTVYRLGGDEFVILYGCHETSQKAVVEEVGCLAESLLECVQQPVTLADVEMEFSISIGVSVYPDDSVLASDLLNFADKAMYQAKKDGRNCYRYYSHVYHRSSIEREAFVTDLRRAIARDELELYFQPKINLSTAINDGCEALVRWNHPVHGFMGAGQFIPQAEAYGLIDELGRWVIRRALQQQAAWRKQGLNIGRMAVNVSVSHLLSQSFCDEVRDILRKTGCRGEEVEFEITETAYTSDVDKFRDTLTSLQKDGIEFSVDDYGTGFSSLSMLLKLPINQIKIDKSFIDNIETDAASRAIVESTIMLAKEMGLSVVAEGVEHAGQLSMLIKYRCDIVQGYLFCKPSSAAQIQELFKSAPLS